MKKLYEDVTNLIGDTPILKLNKIQKETRAHAVHYAKLEYLNPTGSVKDLAAYRMILDAEEKGLIKEVGTIIEPTSGNTGIGIASIAAAIGYKTILTLPETMSVERRNLLKAYGAKLELTDGKIGMKGAIAKAEGLQKQIPNAIILGQFDNKANAKAHYATTGPEIWDAMDGKIDYFVAGIGTGGTITGVGRYLKEKDETIQIIGVEPFASPVLSGGTPGPHGLQGIGAGFIPSVLDSSIYNEIMTVRNEDAFEMGRMIARKEGILVGISSGAALFAANQIALQPENKGKRIVVLLPDSGDRYLSTAMFLEE